MFAFSKIIRHISYSRCNYQVSMKVNSLQKSYRNFHRNARLCIKKFMEYENKYAYNVMERNGYITSMKTTKEHWQVSEEEFEYILKQNWRTRNFQDSVDAFSKLGAYSSQHSLNITNTMFDNFIDNLTDNIRLATDKELENTFYSLLQWPETDSIRSRNYIEVWVALDDECLNRILRWSFDENLRFVTLFYMLNAISFSDYSKKCLQRLAAKAKQLTPPQLVQTMFFVGVMRNPPFDMHCLELHLHKIFEKLSVDDLAIMSMGFFKSKTPIRNLELVNDIINITMENAKNINEVTLTALLKVIRYSMKLIPNDSVYKLLDVLQHEVPRLSIMCNVHIAILGTSTLTLHKGCLTNIAENIIGSISKTRIKDLERLVLSYGTFSFIPDTKEDFFQKVVNELRNPERDEEIQQYGRSFACCVAFLGLVGQYPVDLIGRVLSTEFLAKTYGKQPYSYGKEVLTILNSVQLFCKNIQINIPSEKIAIILSKKYTDYMPSENYKREYNVGEKMVLDLIKILKQQRGGDEYVIGDHILTHHQRGDIIVCNDKNGKPVQVENAFQATKFGLIRNPPDNNIWIVLVIAGRNAMLQNYDMPSGHFLTKLKELKQLGFKPTLVSWNVYSKLENTQDKEKYLDDLIKKASLNS